MHRAYIVQTFYCIMEETYGSCDGHGDHDEVGVNILWRVEADDYLDVLL